MGWGRACLELSSELRAPSRFRWLAEGMPSCDDEACGGSVPQHRRLALHRSQRVASWPRDCGQPGSATHLASCSAPGSPLPGALLLGARAACTSLHDAIGVKPGWEAAGTFSEPKPIKKKKKKKIKMEQGQGRAASGGGGLLLGARGATLSEPATRGRNLQGGEQTGAQ